MFRKIVSNLAFSPTLVGQLGFYAKRLRKEEATRRIGLMFAVLALVVQSFAVFAPPESANAASGNDIIYGGFKDKAGLLKIYDRNKDSAGHKDIQQIFTHFGISRKDIQGGKITHINSRDNNLQIQSTGRSTYSWQRDPHKIPGGSTVYSSQLYKFDSTPWTKKHGSQYKALVGKRSVDGKWFAILLNCGNPAFLSMPPKPKPEPKPEPKPVPKPKPKPLPKPEMPRPVPLCPLNPYILESDPDCKPCEDNKDIWHKDKDCNAKFELTKTVRNSTQMIDNANNSLALTGDRLEYHLSVKNIGNTTGSYVIKDNLVDVLEYSELVDAGGGELTTPGQDVPIEDVGVLTWPAIDIKPGQTIEKIVSVQVKSQIPATPQSVSNPESYNCRMVNDFEGNNTDVRVECPEPKAVEQIVTELPKTGPGENMLAAGIALAIITYFYARARQVKTEVRLIRRNFSTGTI